MLLGIVSLKTLNYFPCNSSNAHKKYQNSVMGGITRGREKLSTSGTEPNIHSKLQPTVARIKNDDGKET